MEMSNSKRQFIKKRWNSSTIVGAEAITLLELIEVISLKSKHINNGSIQIGIDNRKVYQVISNAIEKPTQYSQDGRAAITRIKEIMIESPVKIKIVLTKCPKKTIPSFQQHPIEYLIHQCDRKASNFHSEIHHHQQTTNIKYHGTYAILINNQISTSSIKEAIRITDGIHSEEAYKQRKLTYRYDMIDERARESLPINKITTSIIKCVHSFNHYGV